MDTTTNSRLVQTALQASIEQDLQTALAAAAGVHCPWQQDQFSAEQVTVDENPYAQITYPWNPADPAAEEFFEQAEQAAGFEEWQGAEIAARATSFFAQVDGLWTATSLQNKLVQKFSLRIPETLLMAIAQQAQSMVASSLSLADQLVQCVDDLLPSLDVEDLHVLARPLAYAMRGEGDNLSCDTVLNSVRTAEWASLSDIEQARVSLAIARYALAELDSRANR
jgi:hypothetical protein